MANQRQSYSNTQTQSGYSGDTALEPRVAKLETGLEILTQDVRSLASIVRDQSQNLEGEIQKLTIAVTQAAGPRKTDWMTILTGLMFVLALGGAVFYPLNAMVNEIKSTQIENVRKFEDHEKLTLHPVGQAMMAKVQSDLIQQSQVQAKDLQIMGDRILQRVTALEANNNAQALRDNEELRMWRLRAMGITNK